jgi:hypothetical protein
VRPVTVGASRAAFAQVPMGAGVFCYGDAAGAATRVSGTSSGIAEALAARIMSFDGGGLLDFLGLVAVKELK